MQSLLCSHPPTFYPLVTTSQKTAPEVLGLELQVAGNYNVGDWDLSPGPLGRTAIALNHWAISPASQKSLNNWGTMFVNYGRVNDTFYHFFLIIFHFCLSHTYAGKIIHLDILLRWVKHTPQSAFKDVLERAALTALSCCRRQHSLFTIASYKPTHNILIQWDM